MICRLAWKELRSDAASRRMAAVRTAPCLVILLGLWLGALGVGHAPDALAEFPRPARRLFEAYGKLLIGLALVIAPALTVGAIAGERRRQTLELLTLAGFGPGAVIAGKGAARLATLLLLVATTVPPLFFLHLYGGAMGVEVAAVVLTAATAAAWGGAVGLLASVLVADARAGMVLALGWIAVRAGVPLAWAHAAAADAATSWSGPLAVAYDVLERGLLRETDLALGARWVASDLALLAEGLVLAGLAARLLHRGGRLGVDLRRSWQGLLAAVDPWLPELLPRAERELCAEAVAGMRNPFTWRELHGGAVADARALTLLTVAALGALGVAYAEGWAIWGVEAGGPPFHNAVTLALAVGALAAAAALAGGTIAAEKESRLLEEFALLGQVKHRYVYGKFFGVFWLSLLLGAPAFVHALALAGRVGLLPALVLLLVLPPALAAAVAHGLWVSLRARTAARGMAASLLALPPLLVAPPVSLIGWVLVAPPGFEQYICMLPIALLCQPLWLRAAAEYVRWVLTQTAESFDAALQAHLESRVG